MIFETLWLDSVGLERRIDWSVVSREDVCEGERVVPLPEDEE
jgi:hypothetical protein